MSRTLKPGMLEPEAVQAYPHPVRAYRNLHFKGEVVYSVKDRRSNRLIGYTPVLFLSDVTFTIREGERARAVLRHERNVHAFADGTPVQAPSVAWRCGAYHPFKYATFVDVDSETPIYVARFVWLGPDGLQYA